MAITAKKQQKELIPAGNHVARCYQMIEIGTIKDEYQGKKTELYKILIRWELPELTKVFDQAKGPQPLSISKEYTLSLGKKANLRRDLDSWRGVALKEEEAKTFDFGRLLGAACMLNIIHKTSEASGNDYDMIAGITPVPKTLKIPKAVNKPVKLEYDAFSNEVFESLPQFLQEKIEGSKEYQALGTVVVPPVEEDMNNGEDQSDLPF